jgi:hypothetical protein
MTQFIPTDFARNDHAAITVTDRAHGLIQLGFFGQDGVTAQTHGMTAERAVQIGEALAKEGRRLLAGTVDGAAEFFAVNGLAVS